MNRESAIKRTDNSKTYMLHVTLLPSTSHLMSRLSYIIFNTNNKYENLRDEREDEYENSKSRKFSSQFFVFICQNIIREQLSFYGVSHTAHGEI